VFDAISATIAGIALAISLVVFFDNRGRETRAARLARRPALVFSWDPETTAWNLQNIGGGPALDVVILQRIEMTWGRPLRMPEMPVDGSQTVPGRWVAWDTNPGLGARYRSIAGEQYSTITADDASRMADGWGELNVRETAEPHWSYR
jgi:uncharacterized protein YndB with AHSA1/START domain